MIAVVDTSTPVLRDSGPERMRSEHAWLRFSAERLDDLLKEVAHGSLEADHEEEVLLLLDEFRRRLFAHLRREEEDGVLERAVAVAPHFARRVERLRGEHRELRRLAQGLVVEDGGTGWLRLRARFVAFRSVLTAHEQGENEVLQRAYTEDLGGLG